MCSTAIVGAGDMSMQQLTEALSGTGLLTQVAKLAGVNIQQVGAALATLGDNGIRGVRRRLRHVAAAGASKRWRCPLRAARRS